LENGIAIVVVGYPAVPMFTERTRFCVSAAHTDDELSYAFNIILKISQKLGIQCRPIISDVPLRTSFTSASLRENPITDDLQVTGINKVPMPTKSFHFQDPLFLGRPSPNTYEGRQIREGIRQYGCGACGPRGFYGSSIHNLFLERILAEFLGTQAAITYTTHGLLISSIFQTFVRKFDFVFLPNKVDLAVDVGLQVCRAKHQVTYRDIPHLKVLIEKYRPLLQQEGPHRVILMGETFLKSQAQLIDLPALVAIKKALKKELPNNKVIILLEDSQAFGFLGHAGRGSCELQGVDPQDIDILIGSFETLMGSVGGFCAGSVELCTYQVLFGISFTFSCALPAYMILHLIAVVQALMDPVMPVTLVPCGRRLPCLRELKSFSRSLWTRRQNLKEVVSLFQRCLNLPKGARISSHPWSPTKLIDLDPKIFTRTRLARLPSGRLYQFQYHRCGDRYLPALRLRYNHAEKPGNPQLQINLNCRHTYQDLRTLSHLLHQGLSECLTA
jgi:7-keto-8-aminopelargonate synthetase-like enzyme